MLQQYEGWISTDTIANHPLPSHANSDDLNPKQQADACHDQVGNQERLRWNEISSVLHVLHLIEQDKLQQNATGDKSPKSE